MAETSALRERMAEIKDAAEAGCTGVGGWEDGLGEVVGWGRMGEWGDWV